MYVLLHDIGVSPSALLHTKRARESRVYTLHVVGASRPSSAWYCFDLTKNMEKIEKKRKKKGSASAL